MHVVQSNESTPPLQSLEKEEKVFSSSLSSNGVGSSCHDDDDCVGEEDF